MGRDEVDPYADIDVDFGAGPRRLGSWSQVLDLTPGPGRLVPAEGPVDWSQLAAFPALTTVTWSGPDRGLTAALTRFGLRFLDWNEVSGDIDLSGTVLEWVHLDGPDRPDRPGGPGAGRVRLPGSVTTLFLFEGAAAVEIDAPDQGHGIDVRIRRHGPPVAVPAGLRRVRTLWLTVDGEVSATVFAGLTDLAELTLSFDAPPGTLTDPAELGRHTALHTLRLDDAYGLDPGALPVPPGLRHLRLSGTRRTTAAALKARLTGGPVAVAADRVRSEAWLAAHLDNPFGDWFDDSKALGRAACAAWVRAVRTGGEGTPDAAERALRGLFADLNAIDERFEVMDTAHREQAGDAFLDLARRLGRPGVQAETWFQEGGRF